MSLRPTLKRATCTEPGARQEGHPEADTSKTTQALQPDRPLHMLYDLGQAAYSLRTPRRRDFKVSMQSAPRLHSAGQMERV